MQIPFKNNFLVVEDRLIRKLDLMIDRVTREKPVLDAWLAVEGGEGSGKTSVSEIISWYIKLKTRRQINMFFRLEPLLNFAKRTSRQIIIWDEPALDSLKSDVNNKLNKDFQRLMATCRVKQHFLITNMVRFYRFNENIVVDRCLGLLHLYSKDQIDPGRFVYVKKSRLETLYNTWNSKHKRDYKSNKSFGGQFSLKTIEVLENNFHELQMNVEGHLCLTYKDYNKIKDKAIGNIGEQENKSKRQLVAEQKLDELRYKVVQLIKIKGIKREEASEILGVTRSRFADWVNIGEKKGISLGKSSFRDRTTNKIITRGVQIGKNFPSQDNRRQPSPILIRKPLDVQFNEPIYKKLRINGVPTG